ncbi:MAG: hypothetical protein HXY42_11380 [Chloroflexi bacterium]|nr:hypothetical protein [Chloroflexota bacterium]
MSNVRQRELFVERILRERDRFEQLLNYVGYLRRMTLKGVAGKWSVKDMLAYLWAHEQFIADRMQEILHNQPYTPCKTPSALDAFLDEFGYPDFGSPLLDAETSAEWLVEKYRNVGLDELAAQEIEAFCSIVSALESMKEETILRHNLYNQITQHTCKQYRRHAHTIRRWLKINDVQHK